MDRKSEVARLKKQIALEYEAAANVFVLPNITSRHDFIEHRQAKLGDYFQELTQHMSPEEAIQLFVHIEKTGNEDRSVGSKGSLVNGKQQHADS
jgi:hypothetical protein